MNKEQMIGYRQALDITIKAILPLESDGAVEIEQCLNLVISQDLYSLVDSPSINASTKDGYAILSDEIMHATRENQVQLKVTAVSAAGNPSSEAVTTGTAIRILTGAKVPDGANAVLAEEYTTRKGEILSVFNTSELGRNILSRGADVKKGELIAAKGSRLTPGLMGTLVAAGYGDLPVYRQAKVAILATGDELVVPGQPLSEGKLYASNLEMLKAWCLRYGMQTSCYILKDTKKVISQKLSEAIADHDAVITSGGAWKGDKDFVAETLMSMGWKKYFHYIRIGPGKPVGFGLLNQKPVFILPGGPPSNLTAFLQIALPGLLRLGGHNTPSLPKVTVRLEDDIKGRHIDWTEFIFGELKAVDGHTDFKSLKSISRLKSMAQANSIIAIPEGVKFLPAGTTISAQLLL